MFGRLLTGSEVGSLLQLVEPLQIGSEVGRPKRTQPRPFPALSAFSALPALPSVSGLPALFSFTLFLDQRRTSDLSPSS